MESASSVMEHPSGISKSRSLEVSRTQMDVILMSLEQSWVRYSALFEMISQIPPPTVPPPTIPTLMADSEVGEWMGFYNVVWEGVFVRA